MITRGVALRVAVATPSKTIARWEAHAIEQLVGAGAEIVAVVRVPAASASASRAVRFYDKLDRRWFGRSPDPFRTVPIASVLPDLELVADTPAQELDAVLVLGHTAAPSIAARLGCWTMHVGLTDVDRAWPGLAPVLERDDVTVCEVRVDGRPVWRSFSRADRSSRRRGCEPACWKTATAPARLVRTVARTGALPSLADPSDDDQPESLPSRPGSARPGSARPGSARPGSARVAGALARLSVARAVEWVRTRNYWEDWALATRSGAPTDAPEHEPQQYTFVSSPHDRFWADPFPVAVDGRVFVFVEEMVRGDAHASIAVLELADDGNTVEAHRRVLETGSHASYPFVFEWQGEWYMVPETRAERQVRCYRARNFPDDWELHSVLLDDVEVVDATIAEIGGRWWMFSAIPATRGASTWDELHAFFGPSPLGPYTPHPANPVKSDIRSARPAGRLFERDGEWYRPAQDCSLRYGWATVVHRITRLDESTFAEVAAARIEPWTDAMAGTHTTNTTVVDETRQLSVLDARMEPRWRRSW